MVVIMPGVEVSGTIILTCAIGALMLFNVWLMLRLHKKKSEESDALKRFINEKFKEERNEEEGPPETNT